MDNKRRATDFDLSPSRPWPLLQRRKIEKLRDQRQEEFERACNDSFDWLENYYQGCVYAARQNKHRIEQRQSNRSTFSRSTDSSAGYKGTPDHQRILEQEVAHPSTPAFAHREGLFDEYGQGTSPEPRLEQEARPMVTTPSAVQNLRLTSGHEVTPEQPSTSHQSHALQDRQKSSSVQFQLRSPRTPKLRVPVHSPRSPYERHRITPRRTRLRVDASAATRKAQRAMKTLRKRTGSYPGETNGASDKTNITRHKAFSRNTLQQRLDLVQQDEAQIHGTERPAVSLAPGSIERNWSTMNPQPSTGLRDSVRPSNASVAYKTPARSVGGQSQALSHGVKTTPTDNASIMEEPAGFYATPGSRARDSMTLLSSAKSRSSRDRDESYLSSTPKLAHGLHGGPTLSISKRNGHEMDLDQDVEIYDADYTRPKSSPFQDSVTPVRFESPRADSRLLTNSLGTRVASNGVPSNGSMAANEPGTSHALDSTDARTRVPAGAEATLTSSSTIAAQSHESRSGSTEARPGDPHRRAKVPSVLKEDMPLRASAMTLQQTAPYHGPLRDNNTTTDTSEASTSVRTSNEQHGELEGQQPHRKPATNSGDSTWEKSHAEAGESRGLGAGLKSAQGLLERKEPLADPSNSGGPGISSILEGAAPRSRVASVFPEKRIIGQRKPLGQALSSQLSGSHMPPSRLLKMASTLPLTTPASFLHATSGSSQTLALAHIGQPGSRASKAGHASMLREPQQSLQAAGTKPTPATSSVASSTLRQGIPRAPLPSSMKATESSQARTEGQGALSRKPFLTSRSALALKKPTRPVLPDSTLTAKSVALSGISAGTSRPGTAISPKKDLRRDFALMDTKRREPTPDSAYGTKPAVAQPLLKTTTQTIFTTVSTLSTHISSSTATAEREVRRSDPATSATQLAGANDGGNPFLAPAPVRQPLLPSWVMTQSQRPSFQEKTILPEIVSEEEDDDDLNHESSNRLRRSGIPEWASWEELERAVRNQSHLNPEDIFGPLPVLDIGEIFPGKKKTRKRTSSAHWGVADVLTAQEVTRYNEDMGWSSQD